MPGKTFPSPSQLVGGSGPLLATVRTSLGAFAVRLFEDVAPNTVANFVGLSTGQLPWTDPLTGLPGDGPLYRDIDMHRVVPDSLIQGGDPTGTGHGGPGYRFADECSPEVRHDRPGLMSMANAGPGTNGSQFFVTLRPAPHLDGRHTIFGEVVDGMCVVESIASTPTDPTQHPLIPVTIRSIAVTRARTARHSADPVPRLRVAQ